MIEKRLSGLPWLKPRRDTLYQHTLPSGQLLSVELAVGGTNRALFWYPALSQLQGHDRVYMRDILLPQILYKAVQVIASLEVLDRGIQPKELPWP